jgi:predicted  nucleic acid-binding Zn-ribbon protein
MSSPAYTDAYVEALRRELTRAQARLTRAERERDRALAENERLRAQIEAERVRASRVEGE